MPQALLIPWEDMKRMVDKQGRACCWPSFQGDPNNADLLNKIGNVYRVTHQFQSDLL